MLVILFDANNKAITAPSLPGEQRLLAPAAHDSQLNAIKKLRDVITSVQDCPMTLPQQPTQSSACAVLLKQLGRTSATDATGEQY
jgi:hypothetical protein